MATYTFQLKNQDDNSKNARDTVTALTAIFVRHNLEPDALDDGSAGFMVDMPLDIYQECQDIPTLKKVMFVGKAYG